jgi:hypothetical protein
VAHPPCRQQQQQISELTQELEGRTPNLKVRRSSSRVVTRSSSKESLPCSVARRTHRLPSHH